MSIERMWDIANTISGIAGLFVGTVLVVRFYIPYVVKRKMAVATGTVFFVIMAVLYLIPFSMSGVVAYIVGIVAVCLASVIFDRKNIPQKIFLSMTIYMFFWISHVIAALPWKLISSITYARPVADIEARTIDWQGLALQGVEDHQRDELFGELVRAVVV